MNELSPKHNIDLSFQSESFPMDKPFAIAHGTRSHADLIIVKVEQNKHVGLGESCPYQRYGETISSVKQQIKQIQRKSFTRKSLQTLMPNGAARNAVDCAIWDLEAKQQDKKVWELAGLPKPKPLITAYTLVIDTPQNMAREASSKKNIYPIFKVKLAGNMQDADRLLAIRDRAPDSQIIIDANESWRADNYLEMIKVCEAVGVSLIEQPFKAADDEVLRELDRPIAICADESCHTSKDLEKLQGKYDVVNIKLDKAGGLTEAIRTFNLAKAMGFKIMLGCMVSTSLSIRPAYY